MTIKDNAIAKFEELFGAAPQFVVRSPGRVNLIGEHTDYNGGFVMPMAIELEMVIALRKRDDSKVVMHSLELGDSAEFDLTALDKTQRGWEQYIQGIAFILQNEGYELSGFEGVMSGNVPIGSGLSSSAALQLAAARAFCSASDLAWEPVRMAQLAQRSEHEWRGVQVGIMDQLISAAGQKDHAILIDCRSLELTTVPLPEETAVVILDTMSRRDLGHSEYNKRFQECHDAAEALGVGALRELDSAEFAQKKSQLNPIHQKRAQHVITENERTEAAAIAMQAGNATLLGELMNASHASLRHDFEVTNDALNIIVEIAQRQPSCFGARMTGAGFGGCAVALVNADHAEAFAEAVAVAYEAELSIRPNLYISKAATGTSVL